MNNGFQCFWDDFELTGGIPIIDMSAPVLTTGWVGAYNFRFDLGDIPVYFDDLILNEAGPTPTHKASWGALKALYR